MARQRRTRDRHRELARIAAPAAFLLAATIAVLLIRSGMKGGDTTTTHAVPTVLTTTRAATTVARPKPKPKHKPPAQGAQYYTVASGDTFGGIATRYGTTVEELQALNPGVDSTSLSVGQRIRVK